MKIEVGEFVRTECGIAKVKDISIKNEVYDLDKDIMFIHEENWQNTCTKSQIIKHSKNLIDLIEVGDYVNGHRVIYVCNEEPCPSGKYVDIDCDRPSEYCTLWETEIGSIVTHEQFESMKYKVEELNG